MARKFRSYRLSRRAEADLEGIYAFTAQTWSHRQAERYNADILQALAGLVSGAKLGRRREELPEGYRSLPVGSHVIVYEEAEIISVARILHSAMDPSRHLT